MERDSSTSRRRAADDLQSILDDHPGEFDEWEVEAIRSAILYLRKMPRGTGGSDSVTALSEEVERLAGDARDQNALRELRDELRDLE